MLVDLIPHALPRFATVAAIVCLFDLTPAADASDGAADRQAAVIRGLRPPTAVEGASWTLADRMATLHVPGVAIAVIRDYQIDWVAGFGVRDAASGAPVTKDTMFQAGSISKTVAAIGALALVAQGKLSLEAPVSTFLKSWRLPENDLTKAVPLTLTHTLSHTGGVTVHGFLGYHRFEQVPTLTQVLDGALPANSPPIVIDTVPGSPFRYAGGGTTIMQQAMIDVSGQPFAAILDSLVFRPLELTHSTYEQPLPEDRFPNHCAGHLEDGQPTAGRFQVHPELGAAGLWVSAEDLAKIVIDLQLALRDGTGRVLDKKMVDRMVTPVGAGPTGLGVFVESHAGDTYFQHGGANVGFRNQFYAGRDNGSGVVVLTNGDGGGRLLVDVVTAVAATYGWDGFEDTPIPAARADAKAEAEELENAPGRYEIGLHEVLVVTRDGDHLFAQWPPQPPERLARVGKRAWFAMNRGERVEFDEPSDTGYEDAYVVVGKARKYLERLTDTELTPSELLFAGRIDDAIAALVGVAKEDAKDPLIAADRIEQTVTLLLGMGRAADAVVLARWNVELHPEAADALDSLGRACLLAGDRESAARAYTTAIAKIDAAFPSEEALRHSVRATSVAGLAEAQGKKPATAR